LVEAVDWPNEGGEEKEKIKEKKEKCNTIIKNILKNSNSQKNLKSYQTHFNVKNKNFNNVTKPCPLNAFQIGPKVNKKGKPKGTIFIELLRDNGLYSIITNTKAELI